MQFRRSCSFDAFHLVSAGCPHTSPPHRARMNSAFTDSSRIYQGFFKTRSSPNAIVGSPALASRQATDASAPVDVPGPACREDERPCVPSLSTALDGDER
jgi:hypothetical protein